MQNNELDCIVLREKNLLSRLLYPNPVCLLTVNFGCDVEPLGFERNIMTISWLTPVDNYGNFICSINKKRHSADLLMKAKAFVLNVPVHGQESMVISIGSVSGRAVDKFDLLGIRVTSPGRSVRVDLTSTSEHEDRSGRTETTPSGAAESHSLPSTAKGSSQGRREAQERQENSRLIAVAGVAAHIVCDVCSPLTDAPGAGGSGDHPAPAAGRSRSDGKG